MAGGSSFAKRREALEQACVALEGFDSRLWQVQGAELAPLMELVDTVARRVEAARFAILAEGVERGEVEGGSSGAQRWLREHAPSTRAGGSSRIVTVVEQTRRQRYAGLRRSVLEARMPVSQAAVVVDEFERVGHRLVPEAHDIVLDGLVCLAETGGPRDVRALRKRLVARYGYDGEFQGEQDTAHDRTSLSAPFEDGSGLYEYRVVADAEAKAVIEAAVQALSAPRPAEGEPDRRPSGQRRFEALVEVVRRGVASAQGVPTTPKAELFVTMDLCDLRGRADAGTVFGSGEAGELLGPETVRRIACDAGVVPAVLGSDGEIVDLGRRHRLFSSAQVRALWLRDGHCSFPGCAVPASWCDAHHIWHWVDGGPTDLANAALLCGRHHQVVHAKGYHGEVGDHRVVWHVVPGSYDHWLQRHRAEAGDRAAGHGVPGTDLPAVRRFDAWDQVGTGAPVRRATARWRW